ncbi:MAG: extracellular solute-binding protein [Oscillospiraceae bacterium]|nr:extracellular solute-binding protein [Oscillospiraceae bacterium]
MTKTVRWVAVVVATAMLCGSMLAVLAGCDGDGGGGGGGFIDPIPQTKVDLTPTEELVIYLPRYKYFNPIFSRAVSKFIEKYHDVNVTVTQIGEADEYPSSTSAYQQRVNSELMANSGPDIILTQYFEDLYKTMDSGMFLNLTDIISQDDEFSMAGCNEVVMDVGVYKGGRYVVPLTYTIPIMLGEQGVLDAVGFDASQNTDFISFVNQLTASFPKAAENAAFNRMTNFNAYNYFDYSGVPLVDYERKQALPDEESFKTLCDSYKAHWEADKVDGVFNNGYYSSLVDGSHVLMFYWDVSLFVDWGWLRDYEYAPVLAALHAMDGGLVATVSQSAAIRAGSPNQLNAWNFIKILLSETIQYCKPNTHDAISRHGFPVNKTAFDRELDGILKYQETFSAFEDDFTVSAVTAEEKAPYAALHRSITSCKLENSTLADFFFENMTPYFEEQKSYDECVTELMGKLRLYMSE